LIENPQYSYGDPDTGNLLIHGDNLLALKSLVASGYAGKVKCIYIDPPYNTGSAFTHYDDMQEHSIWLGLMQQRIRILYELLADDGTLWISLDDEEQAYARVLCDEIFGRQNFVANVIWHKKHTRSNDAKWFSDNHDFILVYAKDKASWRPNLLPRSEDSLSNYTNPDNDPRGVWASGPCHVKTPNPKDIYPIITPSGREVLPPNGTSWRFSQDKMAELIQDNRIYFGREGANIPRYKRFFNRGARRLCSHNFMVLERK
jgi:adenine specific DNA methylase mod